MRPFGPFRMPMPAMILAAMTHSHFHDTQMIGSTGNVLPDNLWFTFTHTECVFMCTRVCSIWSRLCPIDFLSA